MIEFLPFPQDNLLYVDIEHDEYIYALKACEMMNVSNARGEWGAGLMNTDNDQYATRRTGRLGEIALGKLINENIDTKYYLNGDQYDFKVNGITIDVKTSFSHLDPYRVMYKTDTGYIYPLNCDYYIFCYKDYDYPSERKSKIVFDGYITGELLRSDKIKICPSIGAKFSYSKCVPYKVLKPFYEFYYKFFQGEL